MGQRTRYTDRETIRWSYPPILPVRPCSETVIVLRRSIWEGLTLLTGSHVPFSHTDITPTITDHERLKLYSLNLTFNIWSFWPKESAPTEMLFRQARARTSNHQSISSLVEEEEETASLERSFRHLRGSPASHPLIQELSCGERPCRSERPPSHLFGIVCETLYLAWLRGHFPFGCSSR